MTQLRQLSANLYLVESQLDDFDVRGVVIIGSKRTVVWDTLSHPNNMQPVLSLLRERDTIVVYSHADWDHIASDIKKYGKSLRLLHERILQIATHPQR